MLEEGNDTPRGDLFSYLGGHNETRLGSVITRFTARGSGFSSHGVNAWSVLFII